MHWHLSSYKMKHVLPRKFDESYSSLLMTDVQYLILNIHSIFIKLVYNRD